MDYLVQTLSVEKHAHGTTRLTEPFQVFKENKYFTYSLNDFGVSFTKLAWNAYLTAAVFECLYLLKPRELGKT